MTECLCQGLGRFILRLLLALAIPLLNGLQHLLLERKAGQQRELEGSRQVGMLLVRARRSAFGASAVLARVAWIAMQVVPWGRRVIDCTSGARGLHQASRIAFKG